MKTLSRIPFWLWLLILTILCYGVWNASGFSLFHMITGDSASASTKLLLGVITFLVLALFSSATYRALGQKGLIAYMALVGATLYFLWDHGVLNKENAGVLKHFAPFIVALLLAVGSQGSKIYRAITGRVSVEDRDTVHPEDQDNEEH